jgi:hypothetical protein
MYFSISHGFQPFTLSASLTFCLHTAPQSTSLQGVRQHFSGQCRPNFDNVMSRLQVIACRMLRVIVWHTATGTTSSIVVLPAPCKPLCWPLRGTGSGCTHTTVWESFNLVGPGSVIHVVRRSIPAGAFGVVCISTGGECSTQAVSAGAVKLPPDETGKTAGDWQDTT